MSPKNTAAETSQNPEGETDIDEIIKLVKNIKQYENSIQLKDEYKIQAIRGMLGDIWWHIQNQWDEVDWESYNEGAVQ